uniref:Uncharacterized protein n=1 Tax=Sphaerodactylus townsendi TaxID=933632 RepID=A0ACB8EWR5_9SAUR
MEAGRGRSPQRRSRLTKRRPLATAVWVATSLVAVSRATRGVEADKCSPTADHQEEAAHQAADNRAVTTAAGGHTEQSALRPEASDAVRLPVTHPTLVDAAPVPGTSARLAGVAAQPFRSASAPERSGNCSRSAGPISRQPDHARPP